jgi:hypothetical protein
VNPRFTHFDPLFTTRSHYTREVCRGSTVFQFPNNDLAPEMQQMAFLKIKSDLAQLSQVLREVYSDDFPTFERSFYE